MLFAFLKANRIPMPEEGTKWQEIKLEVTF
jgi:hypothetical protein